MFLRGRLTKNGYSHRADSNFSTDFVCDGAFKGAAVLRGGLWDTEGIDDPVRENLLYQNAIHSLFKPQNRTGLRSYSLEIYIDK